MPRSRRGPTASMAPDGKGWCVKVRGRKVNRKPLTKIQASAACARIIAGVPIGTALKRARSLHP